jgi:segregation and condensation protein B
MSNDMRGPVPENIDNKPVTASGELGVVQQLRMVEAILFASAEPLSERSLQARLPDGAEIKELLTTLQAQYAGRGVNLVQAGATWALRTAEDMGPLLTRQAEVVRKLSRAAVEMLAIIAYHQPVTRGEMEEIRGVTISKGTLDTLLEAGWIRPRGRRRTPGRPVTWGTTNSFLYHFDLESLEDLPGVSELKAAGLLDSGPALQSYQETDLVEGVRHLGGAGEDEAGSDDLILPLDPGDGGDKPNS